MNPYPDTPEGRMQAARAHARELEGQGVEREECPQCSVPPGTCANCENDGDPCVACGGSGKCQTCIATPGWAPIEADSETIAAVAAVAARGGLVTPETSA